jgi:toxin ParE1/3/4
MTWKIVFRPEVEQDVSEAAAWYESREPGLGRRFTSEIIDVWDSLPENPYQNSRRHTSKNIRWRYPEHFPYRVIYEILENDREVIILAVVHAARDEMYWSRRI